MGAIAYDFPSVPAQDDPARERLFAGIYSDLERLGLPIPAEASNVVTREALIAHLQEQAGALLKKELTEDPDGVFAGASANATLATRANLTRVVPGRADAEGVVGNVQVISPLLRRLSGFPHGPNVLTAADIAGAKV